MTKNMKNFHEKIEEFYERNPYRLFPKIEEMFLMFEHLITGMKESARASLWELTDSERREVIFALEKDMKKILEDILS